MLLQDPGKSTQREPRPVGYRSAPERMTRRQVFARRNELWLTALERGLPDEDGRLSRCDVRLIAALWGKSALTVERGIESARHLREETARRVHQQCPDS